MLVEAGATQKAKKVHKVQCGLKDIKSVTFQKIMCQLLNLGHFETSKSNFKKNCQSRIENNKLEKGWFGSR